ncbi:MAG TPA: GntR family transcriptional regulator [Candidatus Faecousia intestinigallinarum]|nr:GntR family transcriptional regulator [Candidatus Faecousia intestinigallinarum]
MAEFYTTSLADQVFEKLENDIIQGEYNRGDILTEMKLVEKLGVSRTPIREALRRLEQERLIVETGKGAMVMGLTAEDALDIMQIRQYIEALATYYATENLTEKGKEKLRHILDLQEFYLSKQDAERMRQMDDEFHDTISVLSRHLVIHDTLQPLHRKTRRYRKAALGDAVRMAQVVQEHLEIYRAMCDGDAELAAKKTAEHVESAKNYYSTKVRGE